MTGTGNGGMEIAWNIDYVMPPMKSKTREFLMTDTPLTLNNINKRRKQSAQFLPNSGTLKNICQNRQPDLDLGPSHHPTRYANVQTQSVESSSQQLPNQDQMTMAISMPLEREREIEQCAESIRPEPTDLFGKYHKLQLPSQDRGRSKNKKMSSLNKLFQRIKTEIEGEIGRGEDEDEEGKSTKRPGRRRMCRLKTRQQFEEEYHSYLQRKEKEGVAELFREVNRAMKVSQRRNEGNVFYQNIRKDALNKIDYMHFNQKYYDDAEVMHLHSVVESCNVLIHKKHSKIDAKPLYHLPPGKKTRSQRQDKASRTMQQQRVGESKSTPWFRNPQRKLALGQSLSEKLGEIVSCCAEEKANLKEVRSGMKIFGFYCDKMCLGMQSKQAKLQNFLKWEEL